MCQVRRFHQERSFGQVFAFKADIDGVSVGVRGPVSIHQAVSVSPVEIRSIQITNSVNGEPGEKKSSDTMGTKHFVRFGLYKVNGSINVQLAQKIGFTQEDAQMIKECLRTLFENDVSSTRPEGSMEVCQLYWWEHDCPSGQYSSAKVHHLVHVVPKAGVDLPGSGKIMISPWTSCPSLTAKSSMAYDEEDFLQLSGLHRFKFCLRQWALIHIENQ